MSQNGVQLFYCGVSILAYQVLRFGNRAQVGIAFRHGSGLMADKAGDLEQGSALDGLPGTIGMPQRMENHLIERVNPGRIEAAFAGGAVKRLISAGTYRDSTPASEYQIGRAFTYPFFKHRPDSLRNPVSAILRAVPSPIDDNPTLHINALQMQILHIRWEKARFLGYEIDSVLINLPTGEDDNSFPPLQGFRKGVPGCIVQGNAAPSGFAPELPDPRFM